MSTINDISEAVLNGRLKYISGLIERALDEGISAAHILENGMLPAFSSICERFSGDELFMPDVVISSLTVKAGLAILRDLLPPGAHAWAGRAVIGTVKGDLHDIGKSILTMILELCGYEVIDLGVDIDSETFLEAVRSCPDCRFVALSALLTASMEAMRETASLLRSAGIGVPIIVGGAPITQKFCDSIGADYYTPDAASFMKLIKSFK